MTWATMTILPDGHFELEFLILRGIIMNPYNCILKKKKREILPSQKEEVFNPLLRYCFRNQWKDCYCQWKFWRKQKSIMEKRKRHPWNCFETNHFWTALMIYASKWHIQQLSVLQLFSTRLLIVYINVSIGTILEKEVHQ